WPVPDSSQMTTVDAPISISESRPNPASATDRGEGQHHNPRHVPAQRGVLQRETPAQRGLPGSVTHGGHGLSLPVTPAGPETSYACDGPPGKDGAGRGRPVTWCAQRRGLYRTSPFG